MNKLILSTAITISIFSTQGFASDWSYDSDSNAGPDKWASLAPENTLCSNGKNQSPVNIDTKKTANIQTAGIKFDYGMTLPETISNTGNMLQIKTGGWAKIKVDSIEFALQKIELHIPSENTIDGKHYPMEIEFIHQSKDKQIAIVSRMAVPGRPDRTLRKLMENLPMKAGETSKVSHNALKNTEMKKKYGNYYRYNGSITTPPCEEGVRWFIMKQPISFSKEQYETLKKAIPQDNNRPTQKLNARLILQ